MSTGNNQTNLESRSDSSLVSVYQSSVDNKSRLVSVLLKPEEKKEEDTSDSDSGCYLISLEDEEVEDRDRSVSIIPRDNILSGSVLGGMWNTKYCRTDVLLKISTGRISK